ncbi:molybdate ABC transporter substrate-binding protein [Albirhodobacter sp. R86504]|uniref:molybdate ABC transporter substrate-binding protein n=1 Tax=Albirhodobacter sp. R86504 TaxID=3093848 RepID=UPI00366B214D
MKAFTHRTARRAQHLVTALVVSAALHAQAARADGVTASQTAIVAVATNFKPVADQLVTAFEAHSEHRITLAAGSTGKLAAQISSGAPFDLFLSADVTTPSHLIETGDAVAGSQASYAVGALLMWAGGAPITDPVTSLEAARHIAIANPALAPYGLAARETLAKLHPSSAGTVWDAKIVTGENIGQAYALVATKAADLGFIAASALPDAGAPEVWPVPAPYHAPIRQDLVLLEHGAQNEAAKAFATWLATPQAGAIIQASGYALPDAAADQSAP